MDKSKVDYSLYLVTDSTPAILGNKDICNVVKSALQGGVTIVQYRDKNSDTRVMVETARRLHRLTTSFGVPLLINDRVDVALAISCEGVHLGQDDMSVEQARRLLGPDKIIGATISNVEEGVIAYEQGADYLGIGTVYATATKKNTKDIIGPEGVRDIIANLVRLGHSGVPAVCIGGINATNAAQVIGVSTSAGVPLDGVAVVSAIIAAQDPKAASVELAKLVSLSKSEAQTKPKQGKTSPFLKDLGSIIKTVQETTPLSHNMTNLVVQNFAANVALAVGASPIMANYGEEAADLAKLGGALVINMGTVTPEGIENYLKALKAYNAAGRPVVFDPVGAGATAIRRQAVKTIMAGGHVAVIKGNESEIKTVWGEASPNDEAQRGVDSTSTLDASQKAKLVQQLAARHKNVVVMTGKTDFVSDGVHTFTVSHGHEYLGMITGAGCVLGTTISAMVAVWPQDHLAAAIAGLVLFEVAAERAAKATDERGAKVVRGPGSFVPAFIDELSILSKSIAGGNDEVLPRLRVVQYSGP